MTAVVEARSRTLDLLRAVAVLLVVGRHLPAALPESDLWKHGVAGALQRGGWVGVDLFFVLSGFLVSGLLFKEHLRTGRVNIVGFLARRGLKIYPPFYFLMAFTVAVLLLRNGQVHVPALLRELLFVQNYGGGLWEHTWSLGVEEQFYLLLAAGTWLLLRRGTARPFAVVPAVFAVLAVGCLALRLHVAATQPYSHTTWLYPTHLRLDGLFFGVLLSYVRHYRADFFQSVSRRGRPWLLAGGVACFVPPFVVPVATTPWLATAGLTMLYLGAGMILWALADVEPRPSAPVRGLAWLGARSYSVYLWHIPVAMMVADGFAAVLPGAVGVHVAAYVVGSVVVGAGMNAVLERPVLRLRDRWFPRQAAPAPAPPPAAASLPLSA
jgi:peptidoglycan/LPS O-acetylase OafA/YrhL